jgi:hypothetical protein
MKIRNISEIKPNPNNPRIIKDDKFLKLVQSLKDFPDMLNKRPLVCVTDKDGLIFPLGGNMRLRAARQLNMKTLPVEMADDWTEEQRKEFIIKDNVGFGEWNYDELANDWDADKLNEWGLDVPGFEDEEKTDGEIMFSNELDFESNYIVLKFSSDIDWIQAQSIFDLKSTYSKRANGKPWSKGVGRVVDGVDAIIKIKSSANEG